MPDSPTCDGLCAHSDALARLERKLDQVLAALDQQHGTKPEPSTPFVRALIGAVQHRAFTAREVIAHAAVDPTLAAALETIGATNPKKLGRALRQLEGHVIASCRLERIGIERDGVVWLLRVCEFETREIRKPSSARAGRVR